MEPSSRANERSELPITAHGRLKVTDWVIGTVRDREAAQACAQALMSVGFSDDDVLVESPAMALQQLQAEEAATQRDDTLVRLFYKVEETVTGADAALRAEYAKEARNGWWLIGAHDVQGNQTDLIRNLLVDHGGRCIHLFEPSGVRYMG
jgi:hypothetical protein